jgi:hypothetical protein
MELRRELRSWLDAHITPEVVEAGRHPVADETLETRRAWNRRLADAGWVAGLDEQVAYYEEMDAPTDALRSVRRRVPDRA